jgi:hypothetical protein
LASAGVRVAIHRGRLAPYGDLLAGMAHARYAEPSPKDSPAAPTRIAVGFGPEWQIVGGADYFLNHHVRLRVGEFSFSQQYMSNRTLSPWAYSSGLVIHFH